MKKEKSFVALLLRAPFLIKNISLKGESLLAYYKKLFDFMKNDSLPCGTTFYSFFILYTAKKTSKNHVPMVILGTFLGGGGADLLFTQRLSNV